MRPAGCTSGCWSRTRRTTTWCWCSRGPRRVGCPPGGTATCDRARARGRRRHDRRAGEAAAERGRRSRWSPPTVCCGPASKGSALGHGPVLAAGPAGSLSGHSVRRRGFPAHAGTNPRLKHGNPLLNGLGSVPGMTALRFRGPVLPDGEAARPVRRRRRVTYEPIAAAEHVADGWIVPGLVDAHCHVGLDKHGAVDEDDPGGAGGHRPGRRGAAAARLRLGRRHRLDPRPRGPAPADPGRAAHRAHQALHPQLRPRGRARRAGGVRRPGGAARRRLGQAGRRLDLARRGRPGAVVPGGGLRRGDPGRPRRTAPG